MDLTFVEGVAAVVSGVIVFCGSVWLLLSMVMGPRLAYFISASLTLGFLLIMGVVAWVVLASLAAVKASQGQAYRYPLTLRVVR